MDANLELFFSIAHQALSQYGLDEASPQFIRHSDVVTFKVNTKPSGTFLLRIHTPLTNAMGSHGLDLGVLNSELLWLEALNQDTHLVLQMPIRSLKESLVTTVECDGQRYNCSLLTWLEGQPYQKGFEIQETARQILSIFGVLHLHASHWNAPPGFTRPARDAACFQKYLENLHPAVDGRIQPDDFRLLENAINRISGMLGELPQDRQHYGLLHADGHKGNLLYHQGQVRLIDFSFCAFGNYMYDLAICLADMQPELREACLSAYQEQRPLPQGYPMLIEAFYLASMVGALSFWVENPKAQDALIRWGKKLAHDFVEKFLDGEWFWFTNLSPGTE